AAGEADVTALLVHAREALLRHAVGRRLVLCVDDGHLLDHGSAALVHQLVAAGEVMAVVTVRLRAPVPDAVQALWKDELCTRLELRELTPADLERLLRDALGGPVDGRTLALLWELTRGNALFARELVRHGLEEGALVEDGAIWRWRGPPGPG